MGHQRASHRLTPLLAAALFIGALHPQSPSARGGRQADPMSEWRVDGDTIDVSDNHGGSVAQYDSLWAELAAKGTRVRVVGNCQSACTTLLGHVPRNRICVTPDAAFGFHLARHSTGTEIMWNGYPGDVRGWIKQQGGLTAEFKWMRAPDTYRFFRKC